MKKEWQCFLVFLVGIVLVLNGSPAAYAQAAKAEFTLEEIVITAERREKSIQESPIAVSAMTADSLDEENISGITDLQMRMPSTTFMADRIYIRGIGRALSDMGSDPAIGIFYDGNYNEYLTRLDDMVDVERIETVRGPQSTMYGRNTIGGAINVVFAKPTKEFTGKVSARIGNYEKREFNAILSGPLIGDWLLGRVSLIDSYYGGNVKNLLYNEYVGTEDTWKADFKLLFAPTDNFSMYFQYKFIYESDNNAGEITRILPYTYESFPTNEILNTADNTYYSASGSENALYKVGENPNLGGRAPWVSNSNYIGSHRLDSKEVSLATDFKAGNLTLKHSTFYRWYYDDTYSDVDGGPKVETSYTSATNSDSHTWAQDFQVLWGDKDSSINVLSGIYYYFVDNYGIYKTYRTGSNYWEYSYDWSSGTSGFKARNGQSYWHSTQLENTSKSAYINLDYRFFDKWTLNLGGRYNIDNKWTKENGEIVYISGSGITGLSDYYTSYGDVYKASFANKNDQYIADKKITSTEKFHANGWYYRLRPTWIKSPSNVPVEYKHDWVANTWKAGINYKPSDETMYYLSVSRGYKPGGISISDTSGKVYPFDAEYLLSYEVGWKTQWLEERLRTMLSMYYYDFEGKQMNYQIEVLNVEGNPVLETRTTNAAGSQNYGLELEADGFITNHLKASLQYSLLIAEYTDFFVYDTITKDNIDLKGNTMALSPKHKVTLSASYVYPTDIGDFILRGTYMWQDETVFDMYCRPYDWAKPWDRLDANLIWNSPDYKWQVNLYGKNVFDHASVTYIGSALKGNAKTIYDLSSLTHSIVDPFQFGVEVSYKW